jgi:hypothetical protein
MVWFDLVKENSHGSISLQGYERQDGLGWKALGSDCASGLDRDNLLIATKSFLGECRVLDGIGLVSPLAEAGLLE